LGYGKTGRTDIFAQFHAHSGDVGEAVTSFATPDKPMTMPDDLGKYILIAFAALFVFLTWRAWQIKQASPNWPYVEGEILQARVFARNETGDQQGTPTHEWLIEVRYRYVVDGVPLQGNRLRAFGLHHFTQEAAQSEIAPFGVGQQVKVYYSPAKPTESVLIPG
jgi:hypothetical protein